MLQGVFDDAKMADSAFPVVILNGQFAFLKAQPVANVAPDQFVLRQTSPATAHLQEQMKFNWISLISNMYKKYY